MDPHGDVVQHLFANMSLSWCLLVFIMVFAIIILAHGD